MKIFYFIISIFLIIGLTNLFLWSSNNQETINDAQIDQWINFLGDSSWEKRADAVYALNQLEEEQKTERVKKALIDLLWQEVTIEREGKKYIATGIGTPGLDTIADPKIRQGVADAHAEYFYSLLEAVANLRDVRAIPILVQFMGGGNIRKALVKIGEPAVLPIIGVLQEANPGRKWAAADALGQILEEKKEGYTARGKTREIIKDAFVEALKRNAQPEDRNKEWEEIITERTLRSPWEMLPDSTVEKWFEVRIMLKADVRLSVIRALSRLEDKDIISLLKEISEHDPYTDEREDGTIYYPVREAAAEIIKELESQNIEEEEIKKDEK